MKSRTVLTCFYSMLSATILFFSNGHAATGGDIKWINCGSISNGVRVMAASVQPGQFACPRATLVGERYLRAVSKKAYASVRISVAGAAWICRERLYDTKPVMACVMQREPNEIVKLES